MAGLYRLLDKKSWFRWGLVGISGAKESENSKRLLFWENGPLTTDLLWSRGWNVDSMCRYPKVIIVLVVKNLTYELKTCRRALEAWFLDSNAIISGSQEGHRGTP